MAVNTDIWGTPEEWRDATSYTYYSLGDFKRPKEGVNSYYNAYDNGSLVGGEVPTDLSLAFWGIGTGSILAHPMFLASYWDGDTIKTVAEPINDEEVTSVPCILGYASDGEGQYTLSWWDRYAPADNPGEAAWSTGNVSNIWSMYREIFTAFNYQKVMLVPFVRIALGSPTNGWGEDYVSLKAYMDGMVTGGAYVNYNKILSIGYQLAIGDGEDNRSTGNKELSINIPVNIKGSSRHWEGVKSNKHDWLWFATDYGINTMLGSGMLNPGSYSYARSISPYRRFDAVDFSSLHNIGDSETGLCYKYCNNYKEPGDTQYNSVPIPYYYNPDDGMWQINDSLPWNTNFAHPFPYIECTTANKNEVRDYILKQIAYLGFPFVYDPTLAARGKIGDIGVYLPVFDEYGVTTGEYEEGSAALSLPNSEWTDGREGSGYDPTRKPGEDDFGDLTNRRPTRVAPGGLNFYVTNYQTIYNLQRYLNGAYTPSAADLTADFKGTNPGDYIVSAFKFPVALPSTTTLEDIYIGKISVGFQAYRLTGNDYLDFGTLNITPYFSSSIDFRDYQSKILLFMPFIGTAELDPKIFIGHTLGLIYNIDYLTGSVAAEIKRDGLTIETRTAKLAQTVPFFAGNMGQYQNEIAQTGFAIEQSKIKQITGAVTTLLSIGGAAATVAGGGSELAGLGSGAGLIRGASNMLLERINQESLEYRLDHTQPQIGTISTASAGNAFLLDDRARVLIWRPYMLPGYDQATYSHVVGHATLRAAALSEFSGLTVAAAAELSNIYTIDGTKSASEQELKLIKQALLAGVYV